MGVVLALVEEVEAIEPLVVGDDFLEEPADPFPVALLSVDIPVILQQFLEGLVVDDLGVDDGIPVALAELVLQDRREGYHVILVLAG